MTTAICFTIGYDSSCGCGESGYYRGDEINNFDCQPKKAGKMKFAAGKVSVCDGNEWKALQYEEKYGSRRNPGFSCEDIKADLKHSANGVYWITLSGKLFFFSFFMLVSGNELER